MKKDTWIGSLLWGRLGASLLMLASVVLGAYGFEFSEQDQAAVYQIVSGILGSMGAGYAVISKIRDGKQRGKNDQC